MQMFALINAVVPTFWPVPVDGVADAGDHQCRRDVDRHRRHRTAGSAALSNIMESGGPGRINNPADWIVRAAQSSRQAGW